MNRRYQYIRDNMLSTEIFLNPFSKKYIKTVLILLTFFPQTSDFTMFSQALFENDAFDFLLL